MADARSLRHQRGSDIGLLRQHGLREDALVILLAEKIDVRTSIMAKAARIQHVQTKPVDYDGSLRKVLERLLNLE